MKNIGGRVNAGVCREGACGGNPTERGEIPVVAGPGLTGVKPAGLASRGCGGIKTFGGCGGTKTLGGCWNGAA